MNYQKVVAKAADILEERGHCKFTLEDAKGRVCAFGALNIALHGCADPSGWLESQSIFVSMEIMQQMGLGRRDLATWNNQPERTAKEVIAAFRAYAGADPHDAVLTA